MTPLEQAIARDASCTWLNDVDVSTLEGADMAAVDRRMLLGLVKQMEADARRYIQLRGALLNGEPIESSKYPDTWFRLYGRCLEPHQFDSMLDSALAKSPGAIAAMEQSK